MKKISLIFACVGIISAANSLTIITNPQEGIKVKKTEKTQAAPVQKTKKTEPALSSPASKAEPIQKEATAPQTQQNQHKRPIDPTQKHIRKVATANPVITATPVPIEGKK